MLKCISAPEFGIRQASTNDTLANQKSNLIEFRVLNQQTTQNRGLVADVDYDVFDDLGHATLGGALDNTLSNSLSRV